MFELLNYILIQFILLFNIFNRTIINYTTILVDFFFNKKIDNEWKLKLSLF